MKEGKHVILYVDDDQDFLDSMRIILESSGYTMVEASTAEDGFRTYRDERPDFIIVDLMMEEVDAGTALARQLKADGNAAPVYMLSSVGDSMSRAIDPVELGLAGVFQKPVDPQSLLTTLKVKLRA